MVLSYHGGQFVKASFGQTVLAFDPIGKNSKLKTARFGADVALVSVLDPDMNGVESVTHGERQPFVVSGPGEYEVAGVRVRGFPSITNHKEKDRPNTIYAVSLEGIHLLFLGALGEKELPQSTLTAIEAVDVLFVPIGGDGVLSPSEAHELSVELEAKIVIPIHHETTAGVLGEKDALKQFLKESGGAEKSESKLTLKKKDLEGRSGDVIVLFA